MGASIRLAYSKPDPGCDSTGYKSNHVELQDGYTVDSEGYSIDRDNGSEVPNTEITNGLVLYRNKSGQVQNDPAFCKVYENSINPGGLVKKFRRYKDKLESTILVLRSLTENKLKIIRACDRSRYYKKGGLLIIRKLRKRLGKVWVTPGIFLTLTYDGRGTNTGKPILKAQAWAQVSKDRERFIDTLNKHRKRHGLPVLRFLWCVEVQKDTGYPHLHFLFPGLHFLAPKERIQELWSYGRARVEYSQQINATSYVCKYITKLEWLTDEGGGYLWDFKRRIIGYSKCFRFPEYEEGYKTKNWFFAQYHKLTDLNNWLDVMLEVTTDIDGLKPLSKLKLGGAIGSGAINSPA